MDLYQDRWEAELSYRELKTELVTTKVAFRSKAPDRVLQEVCERAVKVKFSNFPRKRRDRPAAPSPYVNRARHGRKPMPANARLA